MSEIQIERTEHNEKDFEYRMLTENSIPVFLPLTVSVMDDREILIYDTTSTVSLTELAARRPLKYVELCMIIDSLKRCRLAMEEYLLSPSGLILSPDRIFYDSYEKCLKFVIFPDRKEDEFSAYTKLTEFILTAVDYSDEAAVKLAYEMYAAVLNKDYEFEKYIDETKYAENIARGINRLQPSTVRTGPWNVSESGNAIRDEGMTGTKSANDVSNRQDELKADACNTLVDAAINVPRLTYLSVICITILTVILIAFLIIFAAFRPLFIRVCANPRITAAMAAFISIITYIPIINISDIRRAKKLVNKG